MASDHVGFVHDISEPLAAFSYPACRKFKITSAGITSKLSSTVFKKLNAIACAHKYWMEDRLKETVTV